MPPVILLEDTDLAASLMQGSSTSYHQADPASWAGFEVTLLPLQIVAGKTGVSYPGLWRYKQQMTELVKL